MDSGHLQKAPKPFQSALRLSGGLGSSRGSSTARTLLLQPGQVSAQSESQAGGTAKSDRDRVLGVPLTQTTLLRTKTPKMGLWVNRSVGQWVTPAHAWVQLGLGAAPSSAPLSVQARAEAGLGDLGTSPEELRGFWGAQGCFPCLRAHKEPCGFASSGRGGG